MKLYPSIKLFAPVVLATVLALPAYAQTAISTSLTTVQATTGVAGGYNVTAVGDVSATGAAINLNSNTASENVIDVAAGGRIFGTGIAISGSTAISDTTVSITNAGTIEGGTSSIDLSLMTATYDATISNSGVINGNIVLGAGDDIIYANGGTISGTIDAGANADRMNVTADFTTGGAISNLEEFEVSAGTFTVANTITGATSLTIQSGATLDINESLSISGALTQGGTLDVAVGKTMTAATYVPTTGVYNVGVSGTATGLLTLSGSAVDFTNVSVTVTHEGFVADGTSVTIAGGTAGATIGGQVSETSYLYDYTLLVDGNNVDMTVSRTSLSSVADSTATSGVGGALDSLGNSANADLNTLQTYLAGLGSAAAVQDALESFAPAVNGSVAAGVESQGQVVATVESRMAEARKSSESGLSAGGATADGHMWLESFAQAADQGKRGGTEGYDATTYGFTVGADREVDYGVAGMAFSYATANVDSDASGSASTDAKTYQLTLYGTRDLGDGVYMDGLLGAGYNQYDTSRFVSGVNQTAKGDFNGQQYTAKVGLGRNIENGDWSVNPFGSLQYAFVKTDDYTETGAGGANLNVNPEDYTTVTLALGTNVGYNIVSGGTTYRPNATATYLYNVKHDTAGADSTFVGGGASFKTTGLETSRSGVRLGAGFDILNDNGVEFRVNYDADIRDEYLAHSGKLNLRWAF